MNKTLLVTCTTPNKPYEQSFVLDGIRRLNGWDKAVVFFDGVCDESLKYGLKNNEELIELPVDNKLSNESDRDYHIRHFPKIRIAMIEYALSLDFDWVYFHDADMFSPKETINLLKEHDSGIVSGAYNTRKEPNYKSEFLFALPYQNQLQNIWPTVNNEQPYVFYAFAVGLGCCLIKKEELKYLNNFSESEGMILDFGLTSSYVKSQGKTILVDTRVCPWHLDENLNCNRIRPYLNRDFGIYMGSKDWFDTKQGAFEKLIPQQMQTNKTNELFSLVTFRGVEFKIEYKKIDKALLDSYSHNSIDEYTGSNLCMFAFYNPKDFNNLNQFAEYYIKQGIEKIILISENNIEQPIHDIYSKLITKENISNYIESIKFLNKNKNKWINDDTWFAISKTDEFIIFPEEISKTIANLQNSKTNIILGSVITRMSSDRHIYDFDGSDVFKIAPLGGKIIDYIRGRDTLKIIFGRGELDYKNEYYMKLGEVHSFDLDNNFIEKFIVEYPDYDTDKLKELKFSIKLFKQIEDESNNFKIKICLDKNYNL